MELSPEILAALQAKASQGGISTPNLAPSNSISTDVLQALRAKASSANLTAGETSLGRAATVGNSLFGGFLDEASAGIDAASGYLGALSSGNSIPISEIYKEKLAQNRLGLDTYKKAEPAMSTALEVGGSVLSPINKLKLLANSGKILNTTVNAGLQGGIYGAGQAEGNENLLLDTAQGIGLGAGATGALGVLRKGVGKVADTFGDKAQATKNKLFGVQYSDIKKSLDKDVRALGDTEAPIQKALNKLADQGAIKAGDAVENLTAIETQIGELGKQVKSVLGKADAVQPDPLIPNYNFTENYINKLDSDAKNKAIDVYNRLKKSQSNNVLLSEWELEKSALSSAGANTYGMQGADALEANLKKYMAKDIKDAVDNELTKPLYKNTLGNDFKNIKELRGAMADRFKVQGAFTKAVAREGSSDIVQKLKGLTRTTMGFGTPMLIGASTAGPAGALLGLGAGAALESKTGQKALINALTGVSKAGVPVGKAVEAIAPMAGQTARTRNDPEVTLPEKEVTPLIALKNEIGKSKMGAKENKDVLLSEMANAGITDPTEASQFLAQVDHESAGFKKLKEVASGKAYEGKANLGNTQKGDGERFKGRGFIQLTGRYNYKKFGDLIGVDLVNNPELAEKPEIAAKIATAYWNEIVKPKVSDFNDVKQVTKLINGGYNGLEDRQKKYLSYNSENQDILALLTQMANKGTA